MEKLESSILDISEDEDSRDPNFNVLLNSEDQFTERDKASSFDFDFGFGTNANQLPEENNGFDMGWDEQKNLKKK